MQKQSQTQQFSFQQQEQNQSSSFDFSGMQQQQHQHIQPQSTQTWGTHQQPIQTFSQSQAQAQPWGMQQQSIQPQNAFGYGQQGTFQQTPSLTTPQQTSASFQQNSFATQAKPASLDPFSSFGDISAAAPQANPSLSFSLASTQPLPSRGATGTHSAQTQPSNDPFGSFGGVHSGASASYSSAQSTLTSVPASNRATPAVATTSFGDPFGGGFGDSGTTQFSAPIAKASIPQAQAPNPFASPPPQSKPSQPVNPFDLF
jgi:hypothetical protein